MKPIIPPLNPNDQGSDIANLQEILLFLLSKKVFKTGPDTITTPELNKIKTQIRNEVAEQVFGPLTAKLVGLLQIQQGIADNLGGRIEERTAAMINKILKELNAFDKAPAPGIFSVGGKVLNSQGAALAGVAVELFEVSLRKKNSLGKSVSDKSGNYAIEVTKTNSPKPDLEVLAYDRTNKKVVGTSGIAYNASAMVSLNIIIQTKLVERESEISRVIRDIQNHFDDIKLSDLKEDDETSDITYLSNKTGWDSRIIAMAATSHQLGESLKIDPEHIYALLRAGVPPTEESIKSLSLKNVKDTIDQAVKKNVISGSGNSEKTIKQLEKLSVTYLLNNKSAEAISTMRDMLKIRLNANQQKTFAQTQKQVGEDGKKLWTELSEKGFEDKLITSLQLDGKMGFLTGQNAPLIKRVYAKYNIQSEMDLVSKGLYKASEWQTVLDGDVPEGLTAAEYARNLSSYIKMSYPNAVAAELIKSDEILANANVPKDEVVSFLYLNEGKNSIGKQPVKSWEDFAGLSDEAKISVKSMERIYQVTPSDESMIALSNSGLSSAYEITRFTRKEFVENFGDQFPSNKEAEKTHQKAEEVYSSTLGVATTYITSKTQPNVYAISGELSETESEIVANPTLEELLGNLDYCDCEHCKSVLSPAAYFVELLQFIDLDHLDSNPIDALTDRRPDIVNIQLSCENTNVPLPYIDLVNEILEYYIVHGNLDDLKGHDVLEGTSTTDLLAEPQFVNEAAYDLLKTKVFPYTLPFHQPLETLRRIFQMWDVSLDQLLSEFADSLASRKEKLGLTEEEYKTLTDKAFKKLPEYFGQPENNTTVQLNAAIANGKKFCRRMGISYEDLVALLKAQFINPGVKILPLFQQLRINLSDLKDFYDGSISDGDLEAMIPDSVDLSDYDDDAPQWLRDNEQFIMKLITLTDLSPEITECDFADVELRFSLPDTTANKLTALEYHKFHRFLRLQKKTGWSISMLDRLVVALLPIPPEQLTNANMDATFVTLLDRLANFLKIATALSYSEKRYADLLFVLDISNDADLRKTQLAKILKLSLPEFDELILLSGVDPLADDMESDQPSLMKFIRNAQKLKSVNLKIADLAFVLRHNDMGGKLEHSDESLLAAVKILRDALNIVEKENRISPETADVNYAKGKMQLVYDPMTTNNFFDLLFENRTYSATLETTEEGLPDKLTEADGRLSFDPFGKVINYTGIMSANAKTDLESAADSLVLADVDTLTTQPQLDAFISDFKSAVDTVFNNGAADLTELNDLYPELKTIYDAIQLEDSPAAQLKTLVDLLLPELKHQLKINGIQQGLIAILKTEPEIVGALTLSKEVMASAADTNEPIIHDFLSLGEPLEWNSNQTFNFYLDTPATDDYILYLVAPQNTTVTLTIGGADIIPTTTIGAGGEVKNPAPLKMTAGVLHPVELTVASLPAGEEVKMHWRTKGMERTAVPGTLFYDETRVIHATDSLQRMWKAANVQEILMLTPEELAYFGSENSETKGFLNLIKPDNSIVPADLATLWEVMELLVAFKIMKEENEPEENTWLQVLLDPETQNSQNKFLLEYFNFWSESDVTALLAHFGFTRADLSDVSKLWKVYRAMTMVGSIHYPLTEVLTWITNDPTNALVADLKSAIKEKITEAAWLESMPTVSDPVRNLLRDALVDYILTYSKPSPEVDTANKLYEYFLIDVEMDACMKTSRIRMALSTVQLFIQRCLMNLEPDVDPKSIREDHWAWMKRYRVWEANRKVYLYPENWLEPELRDNKSTLFKELEGELLQQEVTDESAELAFLNYLKKLDDIARLRIVGMYLEENEEGNQFDDILHVFGHTGGNNRQYYYRRYEYGYWTPWEKVSLNVEGEHIFPVIWRKRLFLFWLTTFEKPIDTNSTQSPEDMADDAWASNARLNVEVTISWGEYYKGKWTSPKSTELSEPMVIENLRNFQSNKLLIFGRKDIVETIPGKFRERLIFNLRYRGTAGNHQNAVFTFTSKNAPPYLQYGNDDQIYETMKNGLDILYFHPYSGGPYPRLFKNRYYVPGRLFKVNVEQPLWATSDEITQNILTKKDSMFPGFLLSPLRHIIENQFEAPLCYADERSTFFIEADESVFTPLNILDTYYPIDEGFVIYEDIPLLVDKPIPGWPPEELIQFEDEVITNPWDWNEESIRVNENYDKILPVTDSFKIGDAVFDTAGNIKNLPLNSF